MPAELSAELLAALPPPAGTPAIGIKHCEASLYQTWWKGTGYMPSSTPLFLQQNKGTNCGGILCTTPYIPAVWHHLKKGFSKD